MALEAEIDGVGAVFDGGDQAGPIAGRRQQLGLRAAVAANSILARRSSGAWRDRHRPPV